MQGRTRRGMRWACSAGAVLATGLVGLLAPTGAARAQSGPSFDFCGCAGSPDSLGDFDTAADSSTWPPGTAQVSGDSCNPVIRIPLPPDGVLVFDSFKVDRATTACGDRGNIVVTFLRNEANTAVTLLVKGDVSVGSGDVLFVSGAAGSNGSDGAAGVGGAGGPGGFAGGDAAYQLSNFVPDGGAGVGPGGGLGSTGEGRVNARGGSFVGVPELRPLVGGSGGGGGHSTSEGLGCAGAGGGGGGGALLVAANGTLTITGEIRADGGAGGTRRSSSCSSGGGGGSGGAIRLVANAITGSGTVNARGGAAGCCGGADAGEAGGAGRIRMEAITNSFNVDGTSPVAARAPAPGPLVNPVTPTVRITGIDGAVTPDFPRGHLGQIDMVVDAPGVVQVDLATQDVPAGTDLAVTVKPKVGGVPLEQRVTLDPGSCSAGSCVAALGVDLGPGSYIVEARATFEAP